MERFVCSIMTNKLQLIAILTLATVLITGGFGLTQLAYSSGSSNDKKVDVTKHDDDKDDDEHDDDERTTKPTITIVNKVASEPAFGITVSQTVGVPVLEVINPTTTKYTVDSHTTVTILGSPDRPILITGDGNCPENNGGFVNIEKGQNITCIYDDRPVGQAGPSPTVTLKVKVIDVELGVTEDVPPSFQVDGNDVSLNELITLITDKATE